MRDPAEVYDQLTSSPEAKPGGKGWTLVLCPCHDDHEPSLSLKLDDGQLLVKCHAGCDHVDVLAALDLAEVYDYCTKDGHVYGQEVKQVQNGRKRFFVRQPKKGGGWTNDWKGVLPTLWDLPSLFERATEPVFLVEGPKDAGGLKRLGLLATTNPLGAGKWRDDYSETLHGRVVVVIPDNDGPGRKHAEQVATSLYGKAKRVRVLQLPGLGEGEDINDWVERGGTKEQLLELARQAPIHAPSEPGQPADPTVAATPGGEYEVAVPKDKDVVTFRFTDVREGSRFGQKTVDTTVTVHHGTRRPYEGHVNVLSTGGRDDLVKELVAWFGDDKSIWSPVVRQACVSVAHAEKARLLVESDHSVDMTHAPSPEQLALQWRAFPLVLDEGINVLFGDKATCKSLVAMALAVSIALGVHFLGRPTRQGTVIYVDSEGTGETLLKRRVARLLAGSGHGWDDLAGRLVLWPSRGESLVRQAPALHRKVQETGACLVIIDSAGYACGDLELVKPESATKLYNVLKSLEVSVLVLHHETKVADHADSYGTVYWRNGARLMWNIQRESDELKGLDVKTRGLFCRWMNEGREPPDFELTFTFEGATGPITVERGELSQAFDHERTLPVRLAEALCGKRYKTSKQLGEELGQSTKTCQTYMSQRPLVFVKMSRVPGSTAWLWGLKAELDDD